MIQQNLLSLLSIRYFFHKLQQYCNYSYHFKLIPPLFHQKYCMQHRKPSQSLFSHPSKVGQVESIATIARKLSPRELIAFLAGFIIGQLRQGIVNTQNSHILNNLEQSFDLIKDEVIDPMNYIQACIEALQKTKNQTSFSQQIKTPKLPPQRNRMRNEQGYSMVERQSPISKFNQVFSNILSQLALDGSYLKKKWRRELSMEQEEKKTAQVIEMMMAEQAERNRLAERQNMEIIDKIMAQELKNKQQLQNKKIQCQICLVDIEFQDMAPLSNCGHIYHRQCIHEHIKAAIMSNKVDMSCPDEECMEKLSTNDVETYVEGEILDKFYQFSLNKYVESADNMTSWCPTPGCSAVFEFDQVLDNYRCLVCKKHYCLKCRTDYHYGMSCAEYRINNTFSKDDQAFQDFVKGAKFKQCPKCKFWVQRASGCVSMACRCGVEFCYDCGGTGCPHGRCTGSGRNGEAGGVIAKNSRRRR